MRKKLKLDLEKLIENTKGEMVVLQAAEIVILNQTIRELREIITKLEGKSK